MKVVNNIIIVIVILLLLVSCKKYPENKFPILIIPPEKKLEKLVGAKLVGYKINGIDKMDSLNAIYREIRIESYKFQLMQEYLNQGVPYPVMEIYYMGWNPKDDRRERIQVHFSKDKKRLGRWEILKLTNQEFKYQYYQNNQIYEYHYKNKK